MFTHRHEYTVYIGSMFSKGQKLRRCSCGYEETMLFDYTKKKSIWVPGNFFDDPNCPVFIVTESQEALKKCLELIPPGEPYHHARSMADLTLMKTWLAPRFIIGPDYMDTDIAHTTEFRILCMTGHF